MLFSMLLVMTVLATGCGGFQASRSVSPLDFFAPRFMRNEPPPTQEPASPRELTVAPKPGSVAGAGEAKS